MDTATQKGDHRQRADRGGKGFGDGYYPVRPDMTADHPVLPLDLFQVAALADGAGRAADAAIVSLADHGLLCIKVSHSQSGGRFYAEGSPPAGAHPVELALHAAAARPNAPWLWEVMHEWEARMARRGEQAGRQSERMRVIARARQKRGPDVGRTPGASYANLCHEVRPAAAAVQCGLQQLGLLRPGQRATRRRPQRTPAGQDALNAWRHRYQAVKDGAGEEPDLALAVAIWGLRALWNTRLRDITEAISPTTYGTD